MNTFLTAIIAVAALVQAISAIFVALLTRRLVRATDKYAETTETLLKLDWRPDLQIATVEAIGTDVFLRAANLSKPAALVKQLRIGTGGRSKLNHPPQDVETYSLPLLVPGGQIEQVRIQAQLGQYRQKHNPSAGSATSRNWQAGMSVALVYDSGGKENQTDWMDCSVYFSDNAVTGVQLGV